MKVEQHYLVVDSVTEDLQSLRESNQKLIEINSCFIFDFIGGESLDQERDDIYRIKLKFKEPGLYPRSYHRELSFDKENTIWSDCFRITTAVCGSHFDPLKRVDKEEDYLKVGKLVVYSNSGEKELLAPPDLNASQSKNLAQKYAYKLLQIIRTDMETAAHNNNNTKISDTIEIKNSEVESNESKPMSNFEQQLRQKRNKLKSANTIVKTLGCIDGKNSQVEINSTKQKDFQYLWNLYGKLYLKGKIDDIAKKYKFNEFIKAKVGEALVTVPAVQSKQWARFVDVSMYNPNFHWAPIIACSNSSHNYYI